MQLSDIPPQKRDRIVEAYTENPNPKALAIRFQVPAKLISRLVQTPASSLVVEEHVRESTRARAVRLHAIADRLLEEISTLLDRGEERAFGTREAVTTIFIRPGLRDLSYAVQMVAALQSKLADSGFLEAPVETSLAARRANIEALQRLVSEESRRLEHMPTQTIDITRESEAAMFPRRDTAKPVPRYVAGSTTHPPTGRAGPPRTFSAPGPTGGPVTEEDLA